MEGYVPVLNCPVCRTVEMRPYRDAVAKLAIDCCPRCDGLWFEGRGEDPSVDADRRGVQGFAFPLAICPLPVAARTHDGTCPRCLVPLVSGTSSGATLDACPQCSGVWCGDSELQWIVMRSASAGRQV